MQELKVIGIENGALIAASDEGDRFVIAIDAVMQTKIRQLQTQRTTTARVSPRDIQAHIRSGMTREQVAAATGASIDDVERFEGPVLAEREHMLAQALSTSVHVAGADTLGLSFGTVIRERLADLNATDERWACWKDEVHGWMVKVEFTADEVDHDARWAFDARSQSLQPLGSEAITLSQHGEIKGGLIPKLRAVDVDADRFDSGAFVIDAEGADLRSQLDTQPQFDVLAAQPEHSLPTATAAATNRVDEPAHSPNDTADLLEALRKRRGEREAAPEFDVFADSPDLNETVVIERETITIERESVEIEPGDGARSIWGGAARPARSEPAPIAEIDDAPKRRGRTSLPSWDEIVFGSKNEDDDSVS